MNVKTILFPTDFSSKSDEALDAASAMAEQNGAKLLILHVEEPPPAYGEGSFYYGIPDPDREAMDGMLSKLKPYRAGVPFERFLVTGSPAERIAEFAKEKDVDLIVMSSHGRRGLGRMIMGSVAEVVVRKAECPVLIVKPSVKSSERKQFAAST